MKNNYQAPESTHAVIALVRELTGDDRWQVDKSHFDHMAVVKLDVAPNDPHAKAFINACRAAGATKIDDGLDGFTVIGKEQGTRTESLTMQIPQQWQGEELKDRTFFRLVASTTSITTGTSVSQIAEIMCQCDTHGNFFKNNRDAFVTVYNAGLRGQVKFIGTLPPDALKL